jgi:hypothetical protein
MAGVGRIRACPAFFYGTNDRTVIVQSARNDHRPDVGDDELQR